jgi:hypothetical protein
MWLRRFLAVGTVALLSTSILSPNLFAAGDSSSTFVELDRSWMAADTSEVSSDRTRYIVDDSFVEPWLTGGGSNVVSLTKNPLASNPNNFDSLYCASYTDKNCLSSDIFFFSVLPVCAENKSADCVASLKLSSTGGEENLQFVKYLDFQGEIESSLLDRPSGGSENLSLHPVLDFEGIPSRDLPPGSRVSLWQSKSASNGSKSFYAVAITMKGGAKAGKNSDLESFQISITPVIEKSDLNAPTPFLISSRNEVGGLGVGGSGGAAWGERCVYKTAGTCFVRADFPENVALELKAKLSSSVTGWLHGRIGKPTIEIESLSNRINEVTISGEPLKIPVEVEDFKKSSLPKGIVPTGFPDDASRWNLFADGDFRFQWFERLMPYLDDKADSSVSAWSLRSVVPRELDPCLKSSKQLMGLVTTNAMMYSGEAPNFEKGFLSYRVAGLHKAPSDEIWRGSYDLVMRSESARCLYKFTKAPVSASIQVVNAGGENQVSTTSLNEKNGWLRFGAYNFTFSSPTIRVKLTQEESAAPSKAKRSTITCAKGKAVKRITGVSPKCPAGYKKK